MAFKVNGVEVFSNNGALAKQSITAARDGASSDITGTDELIVFDGDGGDDLMKVTVDELFVRDLDADPINMGKISPTEVNIRYFNDFTGEFDVTKSTINVKTITNLASDQFQQVFAWDFSPSAVPNIAVLKITTKWTNSDGSRGFDRATAVFDGTTVLITDSTGATITYNTLRGETILTTTNGFNIPVLYYELIGTVLYVGLQNNSGPTSTTLSNITYDAEYYPPIPPAL